MQLGIDVRVSPLAFISHPDKVSFKHHCAVDPFVVITTELEAKSFVHIAPHCSIIGGEASKLVLSDFTGMAAGCRIICGSDDFKRGLIGPMIPLQYRNQAPSTVLFEPYAYLATNVIVFPGVVLGEGAVVAAESIVTKSLDPWQVYRGQPAQAVGARDRYSVLDAANRLREDHQCECGGDW